MKELTDEQLKKASIVDFTDDLDLIRKALRMPNFEVSDVVKFNQYSRIAAMIYFAEYTNNDALLKRLVKIYREVVTGTE
ncbi:MAG TPA: hypothetical protein PK908_05640 [Bacteroidales bacterium]|mgnify:FL=1|nr:hypothetical protein [Bacteroidales bacterium]